MKEADGYFLCISTSVQYTPQPPLASIYACDKPCDVNKAEVILEHRLVLWTLTRLLSRNEQLVVLLTSGRLSEDFEFPQLAYIEQTCLPSDTIQHCTLPVSSNGNAQLGCFSVPTCTDAEVSLFVRHMASEGWFVQQGVLLSLPLHHRLRSQAMLLRNAIQLVPEQMDFVQFK